MTDEQHAMRDALKEAFESGRTVRVRFNDGSVREGGIEEFRDLFSMGGMFSGHTSQVRFDGDTVMANTIMMVSVEVL